MASIDSVFPSNYLKASDLNGASPTVTIDRMEIEPIGRNKEMKPVLYFQGKEKGLVLNKTNASKIAQLTGSKDTDDWAGCKIKLYPTEVEFAGETVDAIRVKAAAPEQPKAKPAPALAPVDFGSGYSDDDSVPF